MAQQTHWYCELGGDPSVSVEWIDTALGPQKVVEIAGDGVADERPTLAVFLHGDSPFGDPVYQYEIARRIAHYRPGIVALAVLRPGYSDDCGHGSSGDAGYRMGDNYTADVVESLAVVLRRVIRDRDPARTVVIGHSGGAALAALLASTEPGLQDRSVLVACPCDLAPWRGNMAGLTGNERWRSELAGLSPIATVDGLDPGRRIDLWVGGDDTVTPPFLSETYADTARRAGKNVSYRLVDGGDHDMILDRKTMDAILSSIFD